jgi:hypothetical protein
MVCTGFQVVPLVQVVFVCRSWLSPLAMQ